MIIHTVQNGDTVFKIARQYGISPVTLIGINGLERPDCLSVGQELLILIPTRTYTLRGGDTLQRVCERFGVSLRTLLQNNPGLMGGERVYPGQMLTVRYDTPPLGALSSIGYLYAGYRRERLCRALPYLTYLAVSCAVRGGGGIRPVFDDREALELAGKYGVRPLWRIYAKEAAWGDGDPRALAEEVIPVMRERGYRGILLGGRACTAGREFSAYLLELRKRLMEEDLLLFTEVDGNADGMCADVADGNVLFYEKCQLRPIPDFRQGEERVFSALASRAESSKIFAEIPVMAHAGDGELSVEEALTQAYRRGAAIQRDDERRILRYTLQKFVRGHGKPEEVCFESLGNLRDKLYLLTELGYMGTAFDTDRIPVSALMTRQALLSSVEADRALP